MKSSSFFRCALLAIVAVSFAIVSDADAVSRSCGANAVANTTNVLCASGTCTAALVQVTTAIEVTGSGCDFDLGGRALSMERNFQMNGTGFIRVFNAGNITLTSTGRFQARGDFVLQNGSISTGGLISLTSTGVISIDGKLDVTGDSAGTIRLIAAGSVTLQPGSEIKGSGISSFPDLGMLFTDGGELDLVSNAGNVTIAGDVTLGGSNQGTGGFVDVTAAGNLSVTRPVDLSGGGGDGGEFSALVGDNIIITGNIICDSTVGGGYGGLIDLTAGEDSLEGPNVTDGGSVDINGASLLLRGSYSDQLSGDGGEIDILALGNILFRGSGMVVRLDAGTNFDGSGGAINLDSGDANFFRLGPLDGNIELGGLISMTSSNAGGDGGAFDVSAGRALTITADITATGFAAGGDIAGTAGTKITLNGLITADSNNTLGDGGFIDFEAGTASDAAS
ncbi:MAG: hypothetical protein ABIR79_19080, partial [Candidatus Binatia bacterium]